MLLAAQAGVANNLSGVTNGMHSAKHAKLYHVCFFISMDDLKSYCVQNGVYVMVDNFFVSRRKDMWSVKSMYLHVT